MIAGRERSRCHPDRREYSRGLCRDCACREPARKPALDWLSGSQVELRKAVVEIFREARHSHG